MTTLDGLGNPCAFSLALALQGHTAIPTCVHIAAETLGIHREQNADLTCADGVCSFVVNRIRITLLIMQFKREFGDGSSDPSTQAGFTMRRTWLDEWVSSISSF